MRRSQLAAICGIAILMSWPSVRVLHSQLPQYTVEDLGTLNDSPLVPRAINAGGHVAGKVDTGDGGHAAFLYDAGAVRELGSLGAANTEAWAINDEDEVVGFSMDADGVVRAFRYATAAGVRPLDLTAGFVSSAFAINASGQIAGYAGSTAYHAFRYTEGAGMIDLGTLGGFESLGYGINDAGQVTGCSWTADVTKHAFVWDGANPMQDLGTLGGSQSCGVSINRTGQVAGWSLTGGDVTFHAFLYEPGFDLRDLGTLGGDSAATAVNDDGTVVGWSATASGEHHAFVFTGADGLVDLNDRIDPGLGWVLHEAYGINASGQIVGVGALGGLMRAFKLTPPIGVTPAKDTAPPRIRSVEANPPIVWPPHHEMVTVRVDALAEDDMDPVPTCSIATVESSEPDTGTSHQDRPGDIVVSGGLSVQLRAELGLKARERLYTIGVVCTDAAGNAATSRTTVRVVKNPWEMRRQ
jgi:probable HAF family extracellular repeat protein